MTSTPNLAKVILNENEDSAIFLGINHVDILKIDGMEFYHYFLIILTLDPGKLAPIYNERVGLFYTVESRDFPESDLVYFDKTKIHQRSIWETTVSASSECAYDTTIKNLGKLIKVPNYDRVDNQKSGKRIFIRKISSNSLTSIEKVLEFEQLYDNTFKYSLLPEIKKSGYNSNSFIRGALSHSGLLGELEFPSCYKSPGLSKTLVVSGDN